MDEYSRQVGGICRGRNKGSLDFIFLLLLFLCHVFGQDLDKLPLDLVSLCIKTSKQHDSAGSSTQ